MKIIGIDPGKTGAIATWNPSAGWSVEDCPTLMVKKGKTNRKLSDPSAMADLLIELSGVRSQTHVFLEKVWAGKGMGGSSSFSFGENFGAWRGICAALGLPISLVTPQAWKIALRLDKGKDANMQRARELFPDMRMHLTRKRDDGRADALLIAEYGRRELGL